MDTWTRQDGRYMHAEICRDLYGLVVMVAHGGQTPARVRSYPVCDVEEGERLLERISKRRIAHGYRKVS